MGPLHSNPRDDFTSEIGPAEGDPGSAMSPEEGVSDFTFVALWMAGSLAGVMTAALINHAPLFRSLMQRLGLRGPDSGFSSHKTKPDTKHIRRPSPEEALPMLADAIIGSSKSAVAKVFGPPQSAVISSRIVGLKPATFWLADTWYYPMPQNHPLAMSIRFSGDSARSVEFVQPPVE